MFSVVHYFTIADLDYPKPSTFQIPDYKLEKRSLRFEFKAEKTVYSHLLVSETWIKEDVVDDFLDIKEKMLKVYSVDYFPRIYSDQYNSILSIADAELRGKTELFHVSNVFWHIMNNWGRLINEEASPNKEFLATSGRIKSRENEILNLFPNIMTVFQRIQRMNNDN